MGNAGLKQHYETASKTGVLQLSNQKLKEIPMDVYNLSEVLRSLDVSKNKITTLSEDIGKLKLVKQFNIESNRVEVITAAIVNMKKLEMFNASNNMLVRLPEKFALLSNLKQVYLNSNKIKDFPIQLLGLKNLEVVELSNNKITHLPIGLSNFYASELNLSQNELSSLGEDLHQAPRLKILKLEENCLSIEAISPSLLRDSKIHTLTVEGNLFEEKQLGMLEGYNEYTERYTAMKKKMF